MTRCIAWLLVLLAGCGDRPLPGQPAAEPEAADPRHELRFDVLYGRNCAGCHGAGGHSGAAIGLASPAYLAIAPDDAIRQVVAEGRRATAMPAFAQSAGGLLSDAQVDALVAGIRAWAPAGAHPDPQAPPYRAGLGDAGRGAQVFRDRCGSCHGADGRGGKDAGALADPTYLALVSDQSLRTAVLAGRPDLGSPDWRAAGMTADDVSDVVAWLAAQRRPFPGQPYPEESRR